MKSYKILTFLILPSFLSGCPASYNVILSNESEHPIFFVYPTGFESKINPGKEKRELYDHDCMRIKLGEDIYEYRKIMPPDVRYFHVRTFSSSINAVFTNDHRFLIYPKENREDYIKLDEGC